MDVRFGGQGWIQGSGLSFEVGLNVGSNHLLLDYSYLNNIWSRRQFISLEKTNLSAKSVRGQQEDFKLWCLPYSVRMKRLNIHSLVVGELRERSL